MQLSSLCRHRRKLRRTALFAHFGAIGSMFITFLTAGEPLHVEVKRLRATPTPPPESILPYKRALTAHLYEVTKVIGGDYNEKEILVLHWSIWDGHLIRTLTSTAGERASLILTRWADYAEARSERLIVSTEDAERVLYYDPASKPVSELEAATPPSRWAEWLKRHEVDRDGEQAGVLEGTHPGWLFLRSEIEHAAAGAFWKDEKAGGSQLARQIASTLTDFQERLRSRQIDLLIVPVPTKLSCYAHHFDTNLSAAPQEPFCQWLRELELNVVDLQPSFWEARDRGEQVYCAGDSHWTPAACRIAADIIAEWIGKRFPSSLRPSELYRLDVPEVIEIAGDLAKLKSGDAEAFREKLSLRKVVTDSGESVGLTHPGAPVILLGDSHLTVFSQGSEDMHGTGAGLSDYLALECGFPMDVIANKGSGSHGARINLYQGRSRNPNYPSYWEGKKLVIWCFSVREFTQSTRWGAKVPVFPPSQEHDGSRKPGIGNGTTNGH